MQRVKWGKGEKNANIYVTVQGTEEMLLSRKFINKRIIQKKTHNQLLNAIIQRGNKN